MVKLRLLALAPLLSVTAASAAIDPALLAGMKARSIGPAGMSGRVAAIEAVESDPRIVYAGAATGGVWKSVNGGLTWTPIFDDQPVAAIGAIAVFQANPAILWVGTGEGNVRNSASVGNGIYKSLDAGKTWQHVGLDKTERIHRIRLHPTDADTAYVCAPGQLWGENQDRGVFKTRDGGKTWTKALYVDPRTGCGDLAMDPSNPEKLIASMWQFRRWPYFFRSGGPGSGVHTTQDGGNTWKRLTEQDGLPKGDLGRAGIAFSASHPNVVYALVEAEKSALLSSTDGGKSFTTVNDSHDIAPRPFYFCDLRVDPVWPNRVYNIEYQIQVSDDSGKSFRPLVKWSDIHGDHHALWIAPSDPNHLYVGDDGGVAVSHDRGETTRFVENLPLAQFYHVAVDMERPYNIYGGLQDNGSWRGPSSVWRQGGIKNHDWAVVGWGDGFDTLPDPNEPRFVYSMWQGGNLGRLDFTTGENRDIKPPAPDGARLRFNWNSGLALDPFAPGTIYYGSQFLHRSTDRGETWSVVSGDLTQNNPLWQKQWDSGGLSPDVTAAENYGTIIAIEPSPIERGVIWTGSDDGRVHVTRDGGGTWTSVERAIHGTAAPAGAWVPHIEASPHAGGTAFVVFDDHRRADLTPYVYRTDDYGKTWKSLATKDLRGYALKVEQDPVKPELLFLGTEFGLWVSLDAGSRWMPWRHGVPTVSVMDMVIHPREHDLVVGTHGRAVYVLDDIRPLRTLDEATTRKPLHLFPIADAEQHWSHMEAGGFGFGSGEFRGANRPYGAILTYWLSGNDANAKPLPHPDDKEERAAREKRRADELAKSPPTWLPEKPAAAAAAADDKSPKVEIRVADASGKRVRTFEGPANLGLNRAVWGFERDGFRPWPEDPPSKDEHPGGPELPPGDYTVTVKLGANEMSQPVRVAADPRSRNTSEDWAAREAATLRAGALQDRIVAAIDRIATTRIDLDTISAKLDLRDKETKRSGGTVPEEDPLRKAITDARKALETAEKQVWAPLKTKGIVADVDALSRYWYASRYIQSSWSPPSPSHLRHLEMAESDAAKALAAVDAVFAKEIEAVRRLAGEGWLALLAAEPRP